MRRDGSGNGDRQPSRDRRIEEDEEKIKREKMEERRREEEGGGKKKRSGRYLVVGGVNADEYGTVRVGVDELCRNYAVYLMF